MDETVASASVIWNDVERCVSAFLDHPHDAAPQPLSRFLPAGPPALRQLVLAELIKADMERRSGGGLAIELERYLAEFPELAGADGPPLDLICEEYHLRRAAGESLAVESFCRRFPTRAEVLRRVLGGNPVAVSTAVGRISKSLREFRAGETIDDFELQTELGRGAFGCVFLARQISLQRQVAVKISADQSNEPQIIAQLDHPRIVRVFDQRLLPRQNLRLLYMEYAPGGTLADVVKLVRETPATARSAALLLVAINEARRKGRLPPTAALPGALAAASWTHAVCQIGAKLADALHYAHSRGVLHRDIKPANVLIGGDGWPKLADFNTSYGSKLDGATPAAHFGGSLAYMSPEQMEAFNPLHERRPEEVDGRSDLYSLAILLWELLHGDRPFDDGDLDRSLHEKLAQMIELRRGMKLQRSASLRDPAATRLQEALKRVLSPEAERRPANGADMARQLRLCLIDGGDRFVEELQQGWRHLALARPVFALAVVALPPFVLAAAFNFWYNLREIIGRFAEGDASHAAEVSRAAVNDAFWTVQWFVNGLLFPIAIAIIAWYVRPVALGLWSLNRGEAPSDLARSRLRERILGIGAVIVTVGGVGWLIAGLTFPLATEWFLPDDGLRLPASFYWHFIVSMVACGAFSSALPYLASTWLALRVYLPRLIDSTKLSVQERLRMERTGRRSGILVLVSFVAPMLAMLLLTLHPPKDPLPLLVLIAGGIFGAIGAYWMNQSIQDDLQILLAVLRAAEAEDTVTDSFDSQRLGNTP